MMIRGPNTIDEILRKGWQFSFEGVAEEELMLIYKNEYLKGHSWCREQRQIIVNSFIALCKTNLETPKGREWILRQFEKNCIFSEELGSNKQLKLIYKMIQMDKAIAQYFDRNLNLNSAAVIRDFDDPVLFEQSKAALGDLFSLLSFSGFGGNILQVSLFEGLNYYLLKRILTLPGMDLNKAAQFAAQTHKWFANLQIVVMEIMNIQDKKAVFTKLDLPYVYESADLNQAIVALAEQLDNKPLSKAIVHEMLPNMTDYRKTIVLLTLKQYLDNSRKLIRNIGAFGSQGLTKVAMWDLNITGSPCR